MSCFFRQQEKEAAMYDPIRSLAAALLLAVALTGCRDDDPETVRLEPPPGALGIEPDQPLPPGFDILQTSAFEVAPPGVSGRVVVMMPSAEAGMPDGMQIELRAEGLPAGQYGWHLHMGTCHEEAPIVVAFTPAEGMREVAQPLVSDGQSPTVQTALVPTAQLVPQQLELRPYSVRIHEHASAQAGRMIACAPIGEGHAAAPAAPGAVPPAQQQAPGAVDPHTGGQPPGGATRPPGG
jgi:hypothetical protein